MRCFIPKILLGLAAGLAALGAEPSKKNRQPAFGWHFAGTRAIEAAEDAPTVQDIWRLPESKRLGKLLVERFAQTPERQMFGRQAQAPAVRAQAAQALLEQLLTFESFGEINGPAGGHLRLSLAVKLAPPQAGEWEQHLRRYLGSLNWLELEPDTARGNLRWRAADTNSAASACLVKEGDWLLFGAGSDAFPRLLEWKASIAAGMSPADLPEGAVLQLRGNVDKLTQWLAGVPLPPLADFKIHFKPEENGVRTEAVIHLREAVESPLPDWNIPTNAIHEPLVSFSGTRGLSRLIARLPAAQDLAAQGIPRQFFSWSLKFNRKYADSLPIFPIYLGWPIAAEEINGARLIKRLPAILGPNILASGNARLVSIPNRNEILLQLQQPLIQPFIRGLPHRDGGVRIAGLFAGPLPLSKRPAPDALFAQLYNAENLVYYQWEIVQQQIDFAKTFLQLLAFLSDKLQMKTDSTASRWLTAIAPKMGNNAVTMATATSPKTLELVRKSYLGLTGAELVAIAFWLESEFCPWINADLLSAWKKSSPPAPDAQTGR